MKTQKEFEKKESNSKGIHIFCEASPQRSYYSGCEVSNPKNKFESNVEKECYFAPSPCKDCPDAMITFIVKTERESA